MMNERDNDPALWADVADRRSKRSANQTRVWFILMRVVGGSQGPPRPQKSKMGTLSSKGVNLENYVTTE